LEHKFFRQYASIIHFDETVGWSEACYYPIEIEKRLLKNIKLNEFAEVDVVLNELFTAFESQGNPEGIKTIIAQLLIDLTRQLYELKSVDVNSELIQSFDKKVKKAETIHDLKIKMRELIEFIVQIVRMEDVSLSPIDKGIQFIKLNLDKEITLQEVAEYSGISTSYFSKQFKKEQGQNYIDFLVTLRMEKSKDLLETTKLTIAQIGELTGYHSYRYFTKIFKLQFGITPTQYREQIQTFLQ
jgi:two-component system response regulator YesN